MTKIRFIGDVHGKFATYNAIVGRSPYPTIQVGDMGYGFYPYVDGQQKKFVETLANTRFIRGNHDDPAVCATVPGYIRDGAVIDNMMFVGGGLSIDKADRLIGVDYWADEELSIPEFEKVMDIYAMTRPDIMVTHDAPNSTAAAMFLNHYKREYPSRTGGYLQAMFAVHQPKLWIFGHWHMNKQYSMWGTNFLCIGELEVMDVDTETFEVSYVERTWSRRSGAEMP